MVRNISIRKSTMLFKRMRDIFEKIIISLKSRDSSENYKKLEIDLREQFLRQEIFLEN